MKVIAISSSRKQGNTSSILNQLKEKLSADQIEVEIIHLRDYKINHCQGCEVCLRKGICPIDDDVDMIMNKLKQADGIIISSPVYMRNISGRLKSFIDRTCRWYHRPELVGKAALVISTTAGSALKSNLTYMENIAIDWGMQPGGKIGRKINNLKDEIKKDEYKDFVKQLFQDKSKYIPSFKQIISFQVQKVLAQKLLEIDRKYWEEKGWANSIYYYECQINIFKRIIGNMFYRFLFKKINPVEDN